MKLAIGSDHAGFELKKELTAYLRGLGHDVLDVGTYNTHSGDYADFAVKVGEAVLSHKTERGILICGRGIGASVAANKLVGIRAGLLPRYLLRAPGSGARRYERARVEGGGYRHRLGTGCRICECGIYEERHVRRLNKVRAIESNRSTAA